MGQLTTRVREAKMEPEGLGRDATEKDFGAEATSFYGNCRSIDSFKITHRIGEGTYGTVCEHKT